MCKHNDISENKRLDIQLFVQNIRKFLVIIHP